MSKTKTGTETYTEALRLAEMLEKGPRRQGDVRIAAVLRGLDAENKALRERLEATPEGLRRYHFVQRSKFGPWVEVEQETEASTAFVKEADIATQAAAKIGGAA